MKRWTASFPGHYIGGHALVQAEDEHAARRVLGQVLAEHGLHGKDAEAVLDEVRWPDDAWMVRVLSNGDY